MTVTQTIRDWLDLTSPHDPNARLRLRALFIKQERLDPETNLCTPEMIEQFNCWSAHRLICVQLQLDDLDAYVHMTGDMTCLECGHPFRHHIDRYGCEFERGDVPMTCRDGGTVMAAAGPCGCQMENWKDYL